MALANDPNYSTSTVVHPRAVRTVLSKLPVHIKPMSRIYFWQANVLQEASAAAATVPSGSRYPTLRPLYMLPRGANKSLLESEAYPATG